MMNSLPILGDLPGGSSWMPRAASTVAPQVDAVWSFILYLSIIFFVGIVVAMVLFAVKYRRKSEDQKTSPFHHNTKLEVWWSVIPTILLGIIFYWGFKTWVVMVVPPEDAIEVRVTGRQWSWQFDYPREGVTAANELVVPAGKPVKLTMTSADVLHSFYIPEFRIKKDAIPRRYTVQWFEAPEPGTYNVLCAEYCGKDHSQMITRVQVLNAADWQKWVDTGGGLDEKTTPLPELGKIFFNRYGCTQCHNVDGNVSVGPALNGKYGTMEMCSDGAEIKIDDDYIRESVMEPTAKIVKGFQPKMPSFKGKIKEKHVTYIIEYLKSIGK